MRTPHVILDWRELTEVVSTLEGDPDFVIDVETTSLAFRTNAVTWVGLGNKAHVFLTPCGHPKGVRLQAQHKEKQPAITYYGKDDPRAYTKTGAPSWRQVEYTVPASYGPRPKQIYPDQLCEIIQPLLFSDRAKIGHNLKFDLMSLAKYYDDEIPPPPYHDTLILTHCLNEEYQSYSLKDLTCIWFGIPAKQRAAFYPNLGKAGIEKYGLDEVARYLAKDLRYCRIRHERFHPRLTRKNVLDTYEFEMSMYPSIMAMEYAGFPVDLTEIDTVRTDLEAQIREVEEKAYAMAEGEFSLSHPESKRWVLFGEGRPMFGGSKIKPLKSQNLPVRSRTEKTQVPQVTQAVLEYYSEHGNDMADVLLQWSGLEKLRGTFIGKPAGVEIVVEDGKQVPKKVEPTGIYSRLITHDGGLPTVHTTFKQHGTKTGRLSAAEPNLQQLPREVKGRTSIRALFVADTGDTLIVADYDQIELRCAGFLSEDPAMLEVFVRGEDIHRRAAAVMFQIDPAKVTDDQRAIGKTQNFAVLYGAGEDKIAQVARCSQRRAKTLIANYYEEFARLEPWKRRLLYQARRNGNMAAVEIRPPYVLIPPFGRQRRIPDLYHQRYGPMRRAERQAVNAQVQGFAASITKLAMRELQVKLAEFPAGMLAQVHDEIVVRAREDVAPQVLSLVERVMSGVCHPTEGGPILGEVPLVVSAASGPTWAAAKGKG